MPTNPRPVQFAVDYPDRPLNRLTTTFVGVYVALLDDRPPFRLAP
ncbi:hypothetical protein [Conexibacter sp. CPCC 206217]|nr:hypothetical protein [Conexibacter sp. CPCC 206217]MDO8213576.1 hypothetical protein [Conexibacter sp. CPCC 206217]